MKLIQFCTPIHWLPSCKSMPEKKCSKVAMSEQLVSLIESMNSWLNLMPIPAKVIKAIPITNPMNP